MSSSLEFVESAQPHSWLLVADNLHSQALDQYKNFGKSHIYKLDANGTPIEAKDDINRSMFLLGGFALENLIKSFIVYENPTWISNGHLNKKMRSHKLSELAALSNELPYKKRGQTTLEVFEDGLESWARYPCALTIQSSRRQLDFNPLLWNEYLKTSYSYCNKLVKLLSKMWTGPHGFTVQYKFDPNFLSYRNPKNAR